MNTYKWDFIHNSDKLDYSPEEIVEVLLTNRNISSSADIKNFFNPPGAEKLELKDFNLSQKDVGRAVKRILHAKNDGQQIVVFGDYDADGVTATAIIWQFLHDNGFRVMPFIPSRFEDGYGLSVSALEKIKAKYPQTKLIITVDNGIVAYGAAEKTAELGIDLIITDHHQTGDSLPKASAIVHSTISSGAAISWLLTRQLEKEIGKVARSASEQLDLVAIGVVADQMELIGVNRALVKSGFAKLNELSRLGLLALVENANIKGRSIGPYEINFIIAPRINATGRLGSAMDSLRLLCVNNSSAAQKYAQILEDTNRQRQKLVEEVVEHAKVQAKKDAKRSAIVIADEMYHEGVVGLAASALVEQFYRPSIVFSLEGDFAKASARSIKGFNIIENIRKFDEILVSGGGHPMAAGFTIKRDDLQQFREQFIALAEQQMNSQLLEKVKTADMQIALSSLNWDLLTKLKRFEPYGLGNFQPNFVTRQVEVVDFRPVGLTQAHVKLKFRQDQTFFEAIGFNLAKRFKNGRSAKTADILYNFESNIYRGVENMQLKVRDIRLYE